MPTKNEAALLGWPYCRLMKRKTAYWLLGTAAVVALAIDIPRKIVIRRDNAALEEQLRLARAEGIPTTAAEFAAAIRPAKLEENAGPIYTRLSKMKDSSADKYTAAIKLIFEPTVAHRANAERILKQHADRLELLHQATAQPHCNFNRDWSDGPAVLFSEFAYMKGGAQLMMLRGALYDASGDVQSALREARRMLVMANHAREEPTGIAQMVSLAIYRTHVSYLADLAAAHRDEQTYRSELAKSIRQWPTINRKLERREHLFDLLIFIDQCATPQGLREKVGLREDQMPSGPAVPIANLFLNKTRARTSIVKAERAYWKALELPVSQRQEALDEATLQQNMALFAFPTASSIWGALSGEEDTSDTREKTLAATRLMYVAALRALDGKTPPRKLDTNDLLSPFDGKPLSYSYDGRRMRMLISKGKNVDPLLLNLPPNVLFTPEPTPK